MQIQCRTSDYNNDSASYPMSICAKFRVPVQLAHILYGRIEFLLKTAQSVLRLCHTERKSREVIEKLAIYSVARQTEKSKTTTSGPTRWP